MKINGISDSACQSSYHIRPVSENSDEATNSAKQSNAVTYPMSSVQFKGGSDFSKKAWHKFKKLSDFFKESDEIVSQIIQFIGTAAIAPFAILVSPSKGEAKKLPKEQQKEKKRFQALRQPISAFIAISLTFPLTMMTKKVMNNLAFEKHSQLFNDKELEYNGKKVDFGQLITSKSYLTKKVRKQLEKNGLTEEAISKIEGFDGKMDLAAVKNEFKELIKNDYADSGIKLSEEQLEKLASKKGPFRKFVSEKIAGEMYNKEILAKVEDCRNKPGFQNIEDIQLVTDKYKTLMKNDYKEEFSQLRKNSKISVIDELVESWGVKTKKMKLFRDAEDKLATEKGLEYLKKAEPELFTNSSKKLHNYVENLNTKAQSVFKRKTDLYSMVISMAGMAVSCLILNWVHPKFANFVDGLRDKRKEAKSIQNKKVEVAA